MQLIKAPMHCVKCVCGYLYACIHTCAKKVCIHTKEYTNDMSSYIHLYIYMYIDTHIDLHLFTKERFC